MKTIKFTIISLFAILIFFSCSKSSSDANKTQNNTLLSLTKKGDILISNDLGENWISASIPENSKKYIVHGKSFAITLKDAVYFKNKWIAVGGCASGAVHKSLLLISEDNGATWKEIKNEATTILNDIEAKNGFAIAVGNKGNILKSFDGLNWTKINIPDEVKVNDKNSTTNFDKVIIYDNKITYFATYNLRISNQDLKYFFVYESNQSCQNWKFLKEFNGDPIKSISGDNNTILVNQKDGNYWTKKEGEWLKLSKSRQMRIKTYTDYNGTNFISFTSTPYRLTPVIGEAENMQKVSDQKIPNLSIYQIIAGEKVSIAIGAERPLENYDNGYFATIRTSNEDYTKWEICRKDIGDKLKGSFAQFNCGTYFKNRFIISGYQRKNPRSEGQSSLIYYSMDGISWKLSNLIPLETDNYITKIINSNYKVGN